VSFGVFHLPAQVLVVGDKEKEGEAKSLMVKLSLGKDEKDKDDDQATGNVRRLR